MLFIPDETGVTGVVTDRRECVYFNNLPQQMPFEYSDPADNMRKLPNIKTMIIGPMIAHDESVNGILQLYNY